MGKARRGVALRAVVWVLWGAGIFLVHGFLERLLDMSSRSGWSLTLPYYLWTSAIPAAAVVAALSFAMREKIAGRRRALAAVACALSLSYLVSFAVSFLVGAQYGSVWSALSLLSWLRRALLWVVWLSWGACLGAWVLPAPAVVTPVSPLEGAPGADTLTDRERCVAEALIAGEKVAEVAGRLSISPSSVSTYRARACDKLGVDALDELVPLVPVPERPDLDVASRAAVPLAVVAFCLGMVLRVWPRAFAVIEGMPRELQTLRWLEQGAWALAFTVLPPLLAMAYVRVQRMWVRTMRASVRLGLILATLVALGFFLGGATGLVLHLGGQIISGEMFALVGYCVGLAWLLPYVSDGGLDTPLALDERRCVYYLRGRGAGELQAQVLLAIARGAGAAAICRELHVARGTVNAYRAQGYELLGVHSRRELAGLLERDTGVRPSTGEKLPLTQVDETRG